MWKKTISYIAAAVTIIAAFIFSGRINRQRISRDNASIDGLRDSIDKSSEINSRTARTINTARKTTGDITRDNRTAINRLRTAREILERAKARADNDTNP